MPYEFRLQDPGEGIHEAEILEISVAKGDRVNEGDQVLVAETDKAAVEIPSPVTGKVVDIKVAEGDTARVGDVLMVIEEDASEPAAAEQRTPKDRPDDSEDPEKKEQEKKEAAERKGRPDGKRVRERRPTSKEAAKQVDQEAARQDRRQEPGQDDKRAASEEAARQAREADRTTPEGSDRKHGHDKRGAREDHRRQSRRHEDQTEGREKDKAKAGQQGAREGEDGGVQATPAVRGLARDLGVDLEHVSGSGSGGRILEDDVRNAASEGGQQSRQALIATGDGAGTGERVRLGSIRRATAKRMARAWREIPHVVHYDAIEITALERLRRRQADEVAAEGGKLTLTPFLVKAIADALGEHPRFNATFDADREALEIKHVIHMGVALDTDRGLMVPVLHNANRKSVLELAIELTVLAKALRDGGRAKSEILKGATFTLTNVGAIGGTGFSPIINPPQVSIFGAARAVMRQVVKGDIDDHRVQAELVLPVCVAFDHRAVDGADAARFMNAVKRQLGDPAELLLRG